VEKMALEEDIWKKILSPLSVAISTPGLHIHVHLQADMPQSRSLENFKRKYPVKNEERRIENNFFLPC